MPGRPSGGYSVLGGKRRHRDQHLPRLRVYVPVSVWNAICSVFGPIHVKDMFPTCQACRSRQNGPHKGGTKLAPRPHHPPVPSPGSLSSARLIVNNPRAKPRQDEKKTKKDVPVGNTTLHSTAQKMTLMSKRALDTFKVVGDHPAAFISDADVPRARHEQ